MSPIPEAEADALARHVGLKKGAARRRLVRSQAGGAVHVAPGGISAFEPSALRIIRAGVPMPDAARPV